MEGGRRGEPSWTATETEYYLEKFGRELRTVTLPDVAGEQPESLWVAMNYIWTVNTTPPEVTSLLDAIQADGYKSLEWDRSQGDCGSRTTRSPRGWRSL